MKRRGFFRAAGAAGLTGMAAGGCSERPASSKRRKLFTFIHFSDIHVQPERGAKEGFLAAIEKMNSLQPDFVVSGGDLIMDALGEDESRATLLYDMYIECAKEFDVPLYNTLGNHEVFGVYVPGKVPESHPLWGKEMFKKRLGEGATYRSFDHKDVHFVLLDSVGIVPNEGKPGHHYIGQIGDEQMAWLKSDLDKLAPETPVVAVSHIPLFTFYPQIQNGPTFRTPDGTAITDGKPLFDLLSGRRLFGFLQGHIHVNELYAYKNMQYIDTGAVSGGWWGGPRDGHPEGFNLVTVWEDGVTAEYVTYGWDASKYKPQEQNAAGDRPVGSVMV